MYGPALVHRLFSLDEKLPKPLYEHDFVASQTDIRGYNVCDRLLLSAITLWNSYYDTFVEGHSGPRLVFLKHAADLADSRRILNTISGKQSLRCCVTNSVW